MQQAGADPSPDGIAGRRPATDLVCIVVPCFNEAARFDSAAFETFLAGDRCVHFLLVDDGSSDGTLAVLAALAAKHPGRVQTLRLEENRGKAEAVRRGMVQAMESGAFAYAGYWDADLATPLSAIELFVATFRRQPQIDIVFGARVALLGRRIVRRASRHYFGRVFATAASTVLALPVYDTQCGAKLLRNTPLCRSLFSQPFGSRWIFDVELLARYLKAKEKGGPLGVYELPLDEWTDVGGSKVRAKDFARAVGEMVAIHRTYRLPGPWRFPLDVATHPFLRYLAVGAIGTSIHYATLIALVEGAGASPTLGSTAGALLGALTNYVLNYHLTFASKRPHAITMPRFLTVAALGVGLNALVMKSVTAQAPGHYLLAQLLASGLVLALGFLVNRLWTFDEP